MHQISNLFFQIIFKVKLYWRKTPANLEYFFIFPPKCPHIIAIISCNINYTDLIFVPFDLALNSASNGIIIFAVIAIPDLVKFCRAIKNRPFTCATFRERLLRFFFNLDFFCTSIGFSRWTVQTSSLNCQALSLFLVLV